MKRLKNSVKAIIISICALVVVAAGVVGAVLLSKNKGGGGDDGQKYVLTPAQKQLMQVINAENKKKQTEKNELKPYDSSSFVDENGFAIDQTKITKIDGEFVVLSTDNGDELYYKVTNGNRTYLLNILEYLKTNNLVSESARNLSVKDLHEKYFFITYEYNDNEFKKLNFYACYISDSTFNSVDSVSILKTYTFSMNDLEDIFWNDYGVQSLIVYADDDNYLILLYLSGDEYFFEISIVNYTETAVSNEDEFVFRYNADYKLLTYDGDELFVLGEDRIFIINESNTSNYISLDSNYEYSLSNSKDKYSLIKATNLETEKSRLLLFNAKTKKVSVVQNEDGYEYVSDLVLDDYFCIFEKNENNEYLATYYDLNLNKIISYKATNESDEIICSDEKYVVTKCGNVISTQQSVDAFSHKETDNAYTYFCSQKFYVCYENGYVLYSLSGADVLQTSFSDFYYLGDQYALAGNYEEDLLIKIDLNTLTYENISNADYKKSTLKIGDFSFVDQGLYVAKVGITFEVRSLDDSVFEFNYNNKKIKLKNISTFEKSVSGKFGVLNLVVDNEIVKLCCYGENSSIAISFEDENVAYKDINGSYTLKYGDAEVGSIESDGKHVITTKINKGYYPESLYVHGTHGTDIKYKLTFKPSENRIVVDTKKMWYNFLGENVITDDLTVTISIGDGKITVQTVDFNNKGGNYIGYLDAKDPPTVSVKELTATLEVHYRTNNVDYADSSKKYEQKETKTIKKDSSENKFEFSNIGDSTGAKWTGFTSIYKDTQDFSAIIKTTNSYDKKGLLGEDPKSYLYCKKGRSYLLFCTFHIYATYIPNEYTFKVDLNAAKVKTGTSGSNLLVTNINDSDLYTDKNKTTLAITSEELDSKFINGTTVKYYLYDSDSYKITGLSSKQDPQLTNYKFVGWAIHGGTKYKDQNGSIAALSGSTTVKGGVLIDAGSDAGYANLERLSSTDGDTVTLVPIFEYADITVRFNYAKVDSSTVYYGINPVKNSSGNLVYYSKQLNPTNTIFSLDPNSSNRNNFYISTKSTFIQCDSKKNDNSSTFKIKYSPTTNISTYLLYSSSNSFAWISVLNKSNYLLTNSQYQLLDSSNWVITNNDSTSLNWGNGSIFASGQLRTPNTEDTVSKYFKDHSTTTKTINFYATYESRVYNIQTDTSYEMNGSLNTSNKYFDNAYSGEMINYGLSKCEYNVAKLKLSGTTYVSDTSSTLYMGDAVYRIKLKSNSTPKYLLSKIELSHFGIYYDSAYREATVTIDVSSTTPSITVKYKYNGYDVNLGSSYITTSGGYYRIGSVAPEGVYFNEFRISFGGTDSDGTYQAVSRNFVIIQFRNLGIPGYYDTDPSKTSGNFSIDATSNKSGVIGFCIKPEAVTNNPTKDDVSSKSNASESYDDYFITPTYVDSENSSTCVWLNNKKYQINSATVSGDKIIAGKTVYYDRTRQLVYAKKSDFIINYKSTSLIAIRPAQTKMNYSRTSGSITASEKYELKSYLSNIKFGDTNINFDCITRYDFTSPTTVGKYGNLNMTSPDASDISEGNTSKKIYYLGSTYSIHSYWTYTYSFPYGDSKTPRKFVLYLTRNDADDEVMYFLFSEYSNDVISENNYTNNISIEFSFSNYSEEKVIQVNASQALDNDLYKNETTPLLYRFNKNGTFQGRYGNLTSTSSMTATNAYFNKNASDTNYYYSNSGNFKFNPDDYVILEIQPNNGYLINTISISIGGSYKDGSITGIMYNALGMTLVRSSTASALYDSRYVFSTTLGNRKQSLISYTGLYKPFTSSQYKKTESGTSVTYNNGVYVTDAYGSYEWFNSSSDNTSLNLNSVYILISGMYDNVKVDVTTISYMEVKLADNDKNLSTKANVSTFSDLNRLQMLVVYNGNWVDLVGVNALSTYPTDSNHYLSYSNSIYTLTFFGCASLFNNGLKISATGDDYSSYFTNGKTYADTENNAFKIMSHWHNTDNSGEYFQFLGRTKTGGSLYLYTGSSDIGKAGKMATADDNSLLTYLCISDFSKFNHRDGKNNYEIFNFIQAIQDSKYEFNMKYMIYLEVKKNEVQAQVNAYLMNESITNTTIENHQAVYSLSNNGIGYYSNNSADYMLFGKTIASNIYKYQLDYVGSLKLGGARLKSDSWFNDVILSNITYKYGSLASAQNWQNITNYKYELESYDENYQLDSSKFGGNSSKISGYNLTYTYSNIPGYYLQYIEIVTVDYGILYLPVVNFLSAENFNTINGKIQKAFASKDSVKNMTLGLSYSLHYNQDTGVYTLKLYDDGTSNGNSGIDKNINSLGILSNGFRVNFYSGSYTYKVITHSNADGTSSNGTLKYLNNSGQIIKTNTAYQSDFTETFTIYYDSSASIDRRMEMVGYSFIGWASELYYNGENFVNRYKKSDFVWNSSSAWFNVVDYFKYGNRASLLELKTKDLYSYDFYIKSSLYPESSGYFITDTGYTGAIGSASRENYNSYNYSSKIENYNFWTVYSKIFTRYLTGTQYSTTYVENNNVMNLYGVWKANVYALTFDTNDYTNGNNGSTPASLNVISSADGGTDVSKYNTILTNHANFNDFFDTNTYSGFKMNSDTATQTYYCYVTFDKNDWFISKSSLGSGTTAYDSYYSYLKDNNGVANIGSSKNYLNIILDRYGYSWLGWFYQKKTNAKQNDDSSFTTTGRVFGSSQYTKYNSSNDILTFNNVLYNQFTTKQEIHSEFIYYGEDVLVPSLKANSNTYYISHYYYGNGASVGSPTDINSNDCSFTKDSVKYFMASDYLNKFNGTKRIYTSGVRKSLMTYYDTSLSYSDYVVNGTGNNVNVKIDRSNFKDQNHQYNGNYIYRNITLYAYWEVNSYEIVVDWQDTDTKSFNSHGSTEAGIYRDSTVYDVIKVKTSPETGDFGKVTLQNTYFDDEELSTRLSNFNPVRVGYDFVGWTFYYYTDGNNDKNVPNLVQKEYSISALQKYQYKVTNWLRNSLTYDDNIPIFQNYSYALNEYETEKQNKLSSHFETFGDGETGHTIYIFALWKVQTFNINVSLNISKEKLENMYDIDSNFATALYTSGKTANGDATLYTNYTGIKSSYYKLDNTTFTEIVANLSFVVTFDGRFVDAYFDVLNDVNGSYSSTRFYLKDLFAVSTGYYLIDWLYDADNTNSILIANTLKTAFAYDNYSCDNKLSEINGGKSVIYTENGENGLFDFDFYNKVWVTNYKKNLAEGDLFNNDNKTKMSEIDNKNNSSAFGFVTIGGKKYYISCEDVVSGGNVYHYQYFKYNGIKYYVLFYYNNGSRNFRFYSDHENLYYIDIKNNENQDSININQRARYIVRFTSNGEPYVVTNDYHSQRLKNFADNIKIAVFTETSRISVDNISQDSNLFKDGYLKTAPSLTNVAMTFTPFATRQFTIYAHWENKSDLSVVISNKNNNDTTSKSNPGLAGFFDINSTGSHTKENVNYNQVFTNVSDSNLAEYNISKSVQTVNEFDGNVNLTYNFYDNLQMNILPYFNGRYLSSMVMKWYGIEEFSTGDTFGLKANYKVVQYIIEYKFSWDSENNSLVLSTININKTGYGFQKKKVDNYTNIYSVMNGTNSYNKLSLIDQTCFTSPEYYFMKIFDYSTDTTSNFGRMDINKISMNMKNLMSSVEIDCKYSIQTYEVDFYSILDSSGNSLEIKEGTNNIYKATGFESSESFFANRDANNAGKDNGSNDPYKTSEKIANRYFATIPQDCAEYSNVETNSFNVPYGYFMYGMFYDSAFYPHRPIDETSSLNNVYGMLRDTEGQYKYNGYEYIYSLGYYYYGTNTTDADRLIRSDASDENKYSSQCAPVLGTKSKFDAATGIRLDGLSFYSFGGWYEYGDYDSSSNCVLFIEYNKLSEATYLKRNITLYGYYFAVNEPTSITFYVYDDNQQKYVPYLGNRNEYTLTASNENNNFYNRDNDGVIIPLENQENYTDDTGIAKIKVFNRYGVGGEKFGKDMYLNNEFSVPLSVDDELMLNKLLRTYWYYEDTYNALYYLIDGVKHYIRYETDTKRFYYLADENNLNSTRYYEIITSSDFTNFKFANGTSLGVEELYKYNFPGSAMFIKIPSSIGNEKDQYYKLKRIESEDEYTTTWLSTLKPRYYAEVYNEKYYILPRNKTDHSSSTLIYDKDGISNFGSDNPISSASIVNLDFYQIVYNDKYYEVQYLTGYDSQGSLYVNPYYNKVSNTVELKDSDGKVTTYFFDYETKELFYEDAGANIVKVDQEKLGTRVHCSVNSNYSITARYDGKWQISGIKIKSLPSPNISYWYGDEQYGFVGYIALTDTILDGLKKSDKSDGTSGTNDGGEIYLAFEKYIDTVYSNWTAEQRLELKNSVGQKVGSYSLDQFLSSLLVADSYELNEYKTAIEYINVNIPVKFEDLMNDPETGEKISLSVIVTYKFNILSTDTEINKNIYAIPIYSPYVMEFETDSVSRDASDDKVLNVDVEKMNVWHFELTNGSVHFYNPVNDDFVNFIVLTYEQYEELKANNMNVADYLTKMKKAKNYEAIFSQTLTNSKLSLDFNAYNDGHYFVFAYYNKTGIPDSYEDADGNIITDTSYVTRVSDNFIHINKTNEGMIFEITTFNNMKIE